eukprot:679414-Pleurochrysis_carterae.AAC.1
MSRARRLFVWRARAVSRTVASTSASAPSRPTLLPRRLSWSSRREPEPMAPASIAAPFSVMALYPRLIAGTCERKRGSARMGTKGRRKDVSKRRGNRAVGQVSKGCTAEAGECSLSEHVVSHERHCRVSSP